jgi:hypothetical protein
MPDSTNSNKAPSSTETKASPNRLNIYFASSTLTGLSTTVIMNPYDRSLYLSIKHNRGFLLRENFTAPYHGCGQALFQRTVFGSMYYIMQSELDQHLYPIVNSHLKKSTVFTPISEPIGHLAVGLTAGISYGIITNPISAIKYFTWGDESRKFIVSTLEMWNKGGFAPFTKGTLATVNRETSYSTTYELMRYLLHAKFVDKNKSTQNASFNLFTAEFVCNVLAAAIGTVASSPFNYARNLQYASIPEAKAPKIKKVLNELWKESTPHMGKGLGRAGFFAETLKIGWGTLGSAVKMGLGQFIFDKTRQVFTSAEPAPTETPQAVTANKAR